MSYDAVVVMATTLFILNSKCLPKSRIILWLLPGDHITNIKSLILIYFLLLSSFLLFFQSEKAFELKLAFVLHPDAELGREGQNQTLTIQHPAWKTARLNRRGVSRIAATATVHLD